MNDENEASTRTSSSPTAKETLLLHPRREPFEYGLLPISKLIFPDGTQTLVPLKRKLIQRSSSASRIDAESISETLQISIDHARLVLETLASVLPSADGKDAGSAADVIDVVIFLYIQSYKRLVPRSHKDAVSVADVWPSTSAFDGCLSALSPLHFVRGNSRRFMPSQADEEAHQLSYLQKHITNILALLAEPVEGEDDESLILTLERFEHLGFLIQFSGKGSEVIPLSQAAPFFANSDPDMPAVPVSAAQVHDWLLQHITSALEHTAEKASAKESGPANAFDVDVAMTDACNSQGATSIQSCASYSRSPAFVEGFSKTFVVRQPSDIKGCSVKVINCHDSVIYILTPLKYATIYGCSDATIVIGAIGKSLRVEHCERVQVITAAKHICIANCRECVFFLGVNQRPLILGDNHKLQIPDWFAGDSPGSTKQNPFPLPEAYMASQRKKHQVMKDVKQELREVQLEENRKRELACALHVHFKDWLYSSGNIRQLYCLQGD